MNFKIPSARLEPFCLGFNVLHYIIVLIITFMLNEPLAEFESKY